MARIKGAMMTRKRRKKTLKLAKGYFGAKSKLFKTAKEAVMKSGNYAYIGRKLKKRDFRRLWITRISAAAKMNGMNYSTFMNGLKKAGVEINRKMLSEIAINDPKSFASLVEVAKKVTKSAKKVGTETSKELAEKGKKAAKKAKKGENAEIVTDEPTPENADTIEIVDEDEKTEKEKRKPCGSQRRAANRRNA